MIWKKKIKFGFTKVTSRGKYDKNCIVTHIFRVRIVRELDDVYEIKHYDENLGMDSRPLYHFRNKLETIVDKIEIYGIYELELNWFERFIGKNK